MTKKKRKGLSGNNKIDTTTGEDGIEGVDALSECSKGTENMKTAISHIILHVINVFRGHCGSATRSSAKGISEIEF